MILKETKYRRQGTEWTFQLIEEKNASLSIYRYADNIPLKKICWDIRSKKDIDSIDEIMEIVMKYGK